MMSPLQQQLWDSALMTGAVFVFGYAFLGRAFFRLVMAAIGVITAAAIGVSWFVYWLARKLAGSQKQEPPQ